MGKFHKQVTAALLCLALFGPLFVNQGQAAAAGINWWNGAYSDRQPVAIKTVDALPAGYSIEVNLNHAAMVTALKSLSSGNDVRIVYWNGTTNQEIDRILAVGSSWNSTKTSLFFKTQASIGASATNTSYYMYFGNSSAGSPPADGNNVYDLYDDFNGGTFDTAKWTKLDTGLSVNQTGGEVVISGTNFTPTGWHSRGFYPTTKRYLTNYISEVNFRIVSQSPAAAAAFEAQIGAGEGYAATTTSGVEWYDGYASNSTNSWHPIGPSNYSGTSTPYYRVKTAVTTNTLSYYEDGNLKGSRNEIELFTDTNAVDYFFTTGLSNQTFDVRFDDAVVRLFTANPPTVVLTASNEIVMNANIAPSLSFQITDHGTGSTCNGVTANATSIASGASVDFGRTVSATLTASQNLVIDTNAVSGFTIFVRSTGPITAPGASIPNLAATNAAPAAFSSSGNGAFGYTTSDSTLSGTANRFATNKWAGFTTTNQEVMTGTGPIVGALECVAYRLTVSAAAPSGQYKTTVAYTAVPQF